MQPPVLRQWQDSDLEPFVAMNADGEVMRHFPAPLTREESTDIFKRERELLAERGWGIWAVECNGAFAGLTGLNVPRWSLPFSPCTEILWRFRKEFWGRGLAHAAAQQALDYGFSTLGLAEIVACTVPANVRSLRLMERLGMSRDPAGDFDHPSLPAGHGLRRHVLYRIHQVKPLPSAAPPPT